MVKNIPLKSDNCKLSVFHPNPPNHPCGCIETTPGLMASQGFWGTREPWPFTFREQGNKRKIKLGTREQKAYQF